MSIDPLVDSPQGGHKGSVLGAMETYRHFTGNDEGFLPVAGFDRDAQYACKEAEQFGRVIGYEQVASLIDNDEYRGDGERSDYIPRLETVVHLFQTEAGALAYIAWNPSARPSPGEDVTSTPIPNAGKGSVLWRAESGQHFTEVALVRRGTIVGEVLVVGFKRDGLGGAAALAVKLRQRIDSVDLTGQPVDVMQVISAPLPVAEWGQEYAALASKREPQPGNLRTETASDWCTHWTSKACGVGGGGLASYQASYLSDDTRVDAEGDTGAASLLNPAIFGTEIMVYEDPTPRAGEWMTSWSTRRGWPAQWSSTARRSLDR